MALDNYANLKASILNWTGRNDISNVVDDFIDMAESMMFANPDQTLRLRNMEITVPITLLQGDRFAVLPDDFLEKYNLTSC